jgi:hypothetical protein
MEHLWSTAGATGGNRWQMAMRRKWLKPRPSSSSSVADVVPERIRWAFETLAIEPDDRLLEIGGGPGVAASLVCERLDRGSLLLIDRSANGDRAHAPSESGARRIRTPRARNRRPGGLRSRQGAV